MENYLEQISSVENEIARLQKLKVVLELKSILNDTLSLTDDEILKKSELIKALKNGIVPSVPATVKKNLKYNDLDIPTDDFLFEDNSEEFTFENKEEILPLSEPICSIPDITPERKGKNKKSSSAVIRDFLSK